MGVYEDMANDAGYRYGTDENRQMAAMIEEDHYREYQEWEYQKYLEDEIYPWLEWWFGLGRTN